MTVLLMVLFIIGALAADILLHGNKYPFSKEITDIYFEPGLGACMADGGEKIKMENKNEQK